MVLQPVAQRRPATATDNSAAVPALEVPPLAGGGEACQECDAMRPTSVSTRPRQSSLFKMAAALVAPWASNAAPMILNSERISELIWSVVIFLFGV